jgi:diguanylate cyclase (GGDEF)-like protein
VGVSLPRLRPLQISAAMQYRFNRPSCKQTLFTSWRDITERKEAEKALEESKRALEAISITDGLTGIANRRRFDEALSQEYARHVRSGAELSLILLDIDHFKAFNDNYGHLAGDDCLRQIGRVIADCAARPADLAARYGGEEFACILPETDDTGAVIIAEQIRRGIQALAIPHKGSDAADCVTASLGVVTLQCDAWLGRQVTNPAVLVHLSQPFPADFMQMWSVCHRW